MRQEQQLLEAIRRRAGTSPLRIMNVCGGHERSISQAGLRSLLPAGLELIPGPGCPVCVCPEPLLYDALRLPLQHDLTLVAFGDMLRVPANVPKGEPRSLLEARAAGADVRPIGSPQEAVAIARADPERAVVFFAAGFETTLAPVAAMIAQGLPENLYLLLAARKTWPAVAKLLQDGDAGFDALIAPGHVATVMGAEEWRFVPEKHRLPCAVAGFDARSLLQAIDAIQRQHEAGTPRLDNSYAPVVEAQGNAFARKLLEQVFTVEAAEWRGMGRIADSGFALAEDYAHHDALQAFPLPQDSDRRRAGEMPPGCACADVVMGRRYPHQCPLYGKACTPQNPVGPCMVSDEGACRIWWHSGVRECA